MLAIGTVFDVPGMAGASAFADGAALAGEVGVSLGRGKEDLRDGEDEPVCV